MELEDNILSEVTNTQKDKHHKISLFCDLGFGCLDVSLEKWLAGVTKETMKVKRNGRSGEKDTLEKGTVRHRR